MFFNLLWVAVTVVFSAVWFASLRRNRTVPPIGLQFVAVAMLAVILLPVISMTDDLQACTAPAESEHLSRRGDLQPSPDQPLHCLPVAHTMPVVIPTGPQMAVLAVVAEQTASHQTPGFFRALTTRAPPAA
jgi:hypothetical protein